jgi:hypothetical protein
MEAMARRSRERESCVNVCACVVAVTRESENQVEWWERGGVIIWARWG